jgi:hypothetical protein
LLPPDEVDDEDVQLLTLIRVCFPALFNSIPRYRNELISGHTGQVKYSQQGVKHEPFDIDPLLAVVPDYARVVAQRLLISLFPKLRADGHLAAYGSHRRQSVQHQEYFDRYFAMGILDHDVSDSTVAAAVEEATRGHADALIKLLLRTADDVRGLVLSKGVTPGNQPQTDAGRTQLADALAKISNDLPSDDSLPFSDQDQVLTWITDLLVALAKDTPPDTIHAVLGQFGSMTARLRTWTKVEKKLDNTPQADLPAWHSPITTHLVRQSAEDFLDHLKQGDDAETVTGVGYQVHFVLRHDPERLRAGVLELLESQETDRSHLASRLVSARTATGIKPDWQLSPDFDQETFNQLAPQLCCWPGQPASRARICTRRGSANGTQPK